MLVQNDSVEQEVQVPLNGVNQAILTGGVHFCTGVEEIRLKVG